MNGPVRLFARRLVVSLLVLGLGAGAAQAQINAYVASTGNNSVLVLDTPANTVAATISGTGRRTLNLSPDGRFLYSADSSGISKIDTLTNAITGSVATGNIVIGAPVTLDGATAYVANNASATISVVDTATMTVTATLPVFSQSIAMTPDGTAVWVGSIVLSPPFPRVIAVIDTATNTVTTFPVGESPNSIAFTPDGAFAYLANFIANTVSVIDTATQAAVATVPVGSRPGFVAVRLDGAFAYAANLLGNSVSVIDTATNTVVATVPVGALPREIAFTPDGAFAYVTNFSSNSISVIDTATLTVVATFAAGSLPWGIVFMHDSDLDGVGENVDACPATPSGETVDATGCSIAQLCPCAGPFGTSEPWKNHGQYVSCVAHSAESFLAAGLITAEQQDAIVTAAAESSCGKQSCAPTFSNFAFGSGAPFGGNTVVAGVGVTLSSTNTEPFGPTSFRDNGGANPAQVQFTFSTPITEFHLDVSFVRADEFLTAFSIGNPTSLSGTLVNQGGFITTSLPFPADNGSGRLSWVGINTKNITFTIGGPINTALAVDQLGLCPRVH